MQSFLLECEQLTREFPISGKSVRVVDAATLQVSRGEMVVIRGASGSGKTTLLMMAAGMLRPSAGLVRVLGQDPYQMSPDRRSRLRATSIGVVLPMFHLLPYLDAADNVALGYVGSHGRTEATKLLSSMGLGERVRQLPDRMSAGERRRLMVARAMLHQPPLVLADEPTANLDSANVDQITGLLREVKMRGGGVLVITHESPARFDADRIYQMRAGRLEPVTDPDLV